MATSRQRVGAGDRAHPFELRLGSLRVAVEAEEDRRRAARCRRLDEIPSVRAGRNRALNHQITLTVPEPRMSASRVMSGRPMVCADAQMSASNGSRVKRSPSATNTVSGVTSSG